MIKIEDIRPSAQELKKIAQKHIKKQVKAIRAGKVIKRRYAASTAKKRRKYGLRVDKVNLTGNKSYDGKSWRLLNSWSIKIVSATKVSMIWTRSEAARIYDHLVIRYGNFLKER